MDSEKKAVLKMLESQFFKNFIKIQTFHCLKSSDISETLRKKGNELFVTGLHTPWLHEEIWILYSMSVAYAVNNSELLSMAYQSRSGLFLHFKKYEAAILDIDRALKITCLDSSKIKLLCRKVKCLNSLGSSENKKAIKAAESILKKIEDKDQKKVLEKLVINTRSTVINLKKTKLPLTEKKYSDALKTLYKKHKVDDFSGIEIKYDKCYGRYLVANKDFKPGDIIYIEKPYIRLLDINKTHIYCSYCFCTIWANIPCDQCSCIMFCSEKCKVEAWDRYHKYECLLNNALKKNNNNYIKLAMKSLFMGITEAGSLHKLKEDLQKFDECNDPLKGFTKGNNIQSHGFKTLYNLSKTVGADNLKEHKINSAVLLKFMSRNGIFFEKTFDFKKPKKFQKNEDALFIGSLVLRLSKIAQLNSFEMLNSNWDTYWKDKKNSRGVYIAPISSLINHSCNPNVRKCYNNDHHIVVYALKTINKGSQLFDCYQEEFQELPLLKRAKKLKKNYNFTCNCEACTEKWPTYSILFHNEDKIIKASKELTLKKNKIDEFFGKMMDVVNKKKEDLIQLNELQIILTDALKDFCKPSAIIIRLTTYLNMAFQRLHGIEFSMPTECDYNL